MPGITGGFMGHVSESVSWVSYTPLAPPVSWAVSWPGFLVRCAICPADFSSFVSGPGFMAVSWAVSWVNHNS